MNKSFIPGNLNHAVVIQYLQMLILVSLANIIASPLIAQTPFINNLDRQSAYVNDTLTISGNNFGAEISDIVVTFGAAQGDVVMVNDNILKVRIPAGATFSPVAVTRLSQKFTAYSSSFFLPGFSGDTFSNTFLNTYLSLSTEEDGLFDLCVGDFDGDGANDIATTNNADAKASTSITVYANQTTTPDILSFQQVAASNLDIGSAARNVVCGDVNGDGKPELIVSQGGGLAEQIFIFQNVSTSGAIAFEDPIVVSVADSGPTNATHRIAVQDLNGDGLPDIVVTNQTVNKIFILANESTNGSIKFRKESIEVPANTLGLVLADLNQDFLPEIVVANNVGSGLYLMTNISTPGNINFTSPKTIEVPGPLINLVSGDIDGDAKADLVVTNLESNSIAVLLNKTSDQDILFDAPVEMKVALQPWGLDLGDVDGNGQVDIIITTLSSTDSITLLANHSTPGTLSLTPYKVGNSSSTRNLKVADLNGDGKPDLCFTDKDNAGNFYLAALRNTTCVKAFISPEMPAPVCESQPVILRAPHAAEVIYQWKKEGADISGATQATLLVTSAGNYSVSIESVYDGCISQSGSVSVQVDGGTIPNAPTVSSPGMVCAGDDVQFTASTIAGVTYQWYGPDGFTSSEQNPLLTNVSAANAGEYFLEVKQGACSSRLVSTMLEINALPALRIQTQGNPVICEGETITLSVDDPSAISYQWKKDNAAIAGANRDSLVVAAPGNYTVSVETQRGCSKESPSLTITQVSIQAGFQVDTKVCVDQNVDFVNQSQLDTSQQVMYYWDFGDGNTSAAESPAHTYQSDGVYQVRLSVLYDNTPCVSEVIKEIEVVALPQVTILPDNEVSMCTGDTLEVRLDGIFTALAWQDGSTGSTLLVTESGTYTVTAYNAMGCAVVNEITVSEQAAPVITIQVEEDNTINRGESVILTATGANRFEWNPVEGLDDPNSANPVASPEVTTTYTVTGFNAEYCKVTAAVTIYVTLDAIDVLPHNLFSPNGDGIDDYWTIENIETYPECSFTVFNLHGNPVYQSKAGYTNDWDGRDHTGRALSEGVYYYVIRCGSDQNRKTGSITIVR